MQLPGSSMAQHAPHTTAQPLSIGVLLFPGFEPLDVGGPVNLWGCLPGVNMHYIAQQAGQVTSVTAHMTWVASHSFEDAPVLDWLLVPGGIGTRQEVSNAALLAFIKRQSSRVQRCMSVCTGSALLAAAGVLDGRAATSNKRAWAWASSQGQGRVKWQREARWVVDGPFVTSSGVAAGMDMAVAVVKEAFGDEAAAVVANRIEYEPHTDPSWDPFAKLYDD